MGLVVSLLIQGFGLYAAQAPGPEGIPGLDKLGHLLMFGVPALLAWLLGARWLVPVLILHALVSEPVQHLLVGTREADPLDAAADLVGIALGVWIAATCRRRWGHDEGMGSTAGQSQRSP
ncbi:VanZ family protein [Serinicoccus kebangsaanensis]|uniref:VanZ family protein n=1 Tax=Serinicoccus kebangsaanensis TaxID=2602069 RepID=UPI00178C6314|nr:VanZ family protein [Serinicoccus kebangsaanensis]